MSALFGGGGGGSSAPAAPAPLPAAPAVDPAQVADRQRKAAEQQLLRQNAGRASTILTGTSGDTLGGASVSKQLTAA